MGGGGEAAVGGEVLGGFWMWALPPTFDLGRIDSSPGLWGRSPLTSEVVQSKAANRLRPLIHSPAPELRMGRPGEGLGGKGG